MADIEYHPLMGTPSEQKARLLERAFLSGDGGNRTRVRKNRPSEIYVRSRLRLFAAGHSAGIIDLQPAARVRRPFLRAVSGIMRGTLPILTPNPFPGRSTGRVDAVSLNETGRSALYCLRSEGHSGIGSAVGTWLFALV